jgi:hypothetical protein
MWAELFRTDTQKNMKKLTVAFHNFVNVLNNGPPTRQDILGFRNGVSKL